MEAKIKHTTGENEGFTRIIKYISQLKNPKNIIINIDKEALEGFDLVLSNLKISNLNSEKLDDRYYITTFICTREVYKNILKLIRALKITGDGGHGFEVKINGKKFYWDGDGSDRITEINDVDCGVGVNFDKKYSQYFPKEDDNSIKLNESELKEIISKSIKKILNK